jgi:S-adenosylmethionine hydrolase
MDPGRTKSQRPSVAKPPRPAQRRPRICTPCQSITLTTDFGLIDSFVGTLKAVIARISPKTTTIDLSHNIPPGDIHAAGFTLLTSSPYCPPNTIHVAVVDPGVGSQRAALVIKTKDALYIGPDNGLLSLAIGTQTILECRRIENRQLCLPQVSATFHGRDIFAPVAAHLAQGTPLSRVGPKHPNPIQLSWPKPQQHKSQWTGEILHIDRFGNAITNLPAHLASAPLKIRLHHKRGRTIPIHPCYNSVAPNQPVAVPGSSGFIEIAINQGSAAQQLQLTRSTPVHLYSRK